MKVKIIVLFILVVIFSTGCSTLAVKAPAGMFVSTGDYVEGIKTLGVIQAHKTVFAPLFIFDINKVQQRLYEDLIEQAMELGADGVTNMQFSWKLSPTTYLSMFVISGVFDFYIEGIAIVDK